MRLAAFWMEMAIVGLIASFVGAGGASAASTEELRIRMVDSCVYDEWKHPRRRDKAATRCKCAAKKAIKTLSKPEIADSPYFGDGLTSSQDSALGTAMKSCR